MGPLSPPGGPGTVDQWGRGPGGGPGIAGPGCHHQVGPMGTGPGGGRGPGGPGMAHRLIRHHGGLRARDPIRPRRGPGGATADDAARSRRSRWGLRRYPRAQAGLVWLRWGRRHSVGSARGDRKTNYADGQPDVGASDDAKARKFRKARRCRCLSRGLSNRLPRVVRHLAEWTRSSYKCSCKTPS